MNKSFCIVLVALAAAFGCMADPVTKTRLGSLNPREGLVVTDVDLSGIGGGDPVQEIARFAATGTVFRTSSYGTPTRWTDATGCVWEAAADKAPWTGGPSSPLLWSEEYGGWISNPATDLLEWSSGTWSLGSGTLTTTFTCSGEWGAMRLVLHSEGPEPDVILERGLLTNLVGRVAFTNDIPAIHAWAKAANKPTYTASEVGATDGGAVTNIVRGMSLGGIWDSQLEVWWTPIMENGALRYVATTNENMGVNQ